jgi:hypothetical protein
MFTGVDSSYDFLHDIHIYIFIYICIHIYMHVCIPMYTYICRHIYIYVYIAYMFTYYTGVDSSYDLDADGF